MTTQKTVAILATLDTKAPETQYLREEIEAAGAQALVIDLGVVGEAGTEADLDRAAVASAGGMTTVGDWKFARMEQPRPQGVAK